MIGEKRIDQLKEVDGIGGDHNHEAGARARQEQVLVQPERSVETEFAKEDSGSTEKPAVATIAGASAPAVKIDPVFEARQKEIENILSENLGESFQSLTRDQQIRFKTAGEKTANQINVLLSETKFKVSKIINLIKSWLSILPGINKFFLEKEAKIKTDAIIQLKKGGEQ